MSSAALVLLLLLTSASSVLLVRRFLLPAQQTVAVIGGLIFWLCNLIVPIQVLALLNLAGLASFLVVSQLFLLNGIIFACALALYLWRPRKSEQTLLRRGPRLHVPMHMALGLFIVLCVYGILLARMAFSFPDTWDSVVYHYPVALRWLQEGTMRITSGTAWQASLPGNVEILDLLFLSARSERLLGSVQWPGLLILLAGCQYLAGRLGDSQEPSWPVVTTILMIPIVAIQSVSGYVDLFGAALLFGSLTLVLEYCDRLKSQEGAPRSALLVAAGLGCGLAVGAKPVFWLYATVLLLNAMFLLSAQGGSISRRAGLYLAGIAIPSLFWFARAVACTGNPFYPLAIDLGPLSLPGVPSSVITDRDYYLSNVRHWAELFVYPWTEWKRYPGFLLLTYGPMDGLGAAFATFAAPGAIFAAWLARKERPDLRPWLVNFALLGIMWWFLLEKVVRFALPVYIFAVLISAPFFEVLEQRAGRLYKVFYVLVFAIAACVLVFEPLYTIVETARRGLWTRAAYVGYPAAIDALPPGSRILSLAEPTLNFALAGAGLTNRVIPNWEKPPLLTTEFLRRRQVDYVVEKFVHGKEAVVTQGPPAEGLEIYFKGYLPDGEQVAEWRIWRTAGRLQSDSAAPAQ